MDRRSSLQGPSIEFTRIPQADPAGSARNDIIEGRVTGASPGEKIVLYAKTGKWWVQPLIDQPITDLRPNFKWTNATHLGTHYAALLVKDGYRPQRVLNSLPKTDDDILAVAVVPGAKRPPSPVINFSGYQWRLRDAPRRRLNVHSPSNISVDEHGAMHLRISKTEKDIVIGEHREDGGRLQRLQSSNDELVRAVSKISRQGGFRATPGPGLQNTTVLLGSRKRIESSRNVILMQAVFGATDDAPLACREDGTPLEYDHQGQAGGSENAILALRGHGRDNSFGASSTGVPELVYYRWQTARPAW